MKASSSSAVTSVSVVGRGGLPQARRRPPPPLSFATAAQPALELNQSRALKPHSVATLPACVSFTCCVRCDHVPVKFGHIAASPRLACSEGDASVTVPIDPSIAVDAVIVADLNELRGVCTGKISEPTCWEMASSQSCRSAACALRAMRSGRHRCATMSTTS